VAHEIRNPLFTIGGFTGSLLRSPSLDDSAREKARIIQEESRRLEGIVKGLLSFARPMEAEPGEADVNQVVRETVELLNLGEQGRRYRIELELAKDLPRARIAPGLLKQALINLARNSFEAMEQGGLLTLSTSLDDDRVRLSVKDTGRGIPPEIQDKVFNPFFSTRERAPGLGLAMTKKVVEDTGGSVRLASEVGIGTQIVLLLPPVLAVEPAAH